MQPGQASISHGLLCQQTDSVSPYVYVFLLSWMRSVDQRFAIAGVDQGPATADAIETCVATESRPSGNQTQSSTAADSGRSPVGRNLVATQARPKPNRPELNHGKPCKPTG